MSNEESAAPSPRSSRPKRYRVINPDGPGGIEYPVAGGKRKYAAHGEVVDDIPSKSVGWLVKGGYIEEASEEVAE